MNFCIKKHPFYLLIVATILLLFCASSESGALGLDPQQKVLAAADKILNEYEVSYVWGGFRLGNKVDCSSCRDCLASKKPKPKQRLKLCGVCGKCSLDCSHFTQLVYQKAGFHAPYLTTGNMLNLSNAKLNRLYNLVDIGHKISRAQPGDMLVYKGHVVLLESVQGPDLGTVVHASPGRDIRTPGQGIQRERRVSLSQFRGQLLKILRHKQVYKLGSNSRIRKLRKVK